MRCAVVGAGITGLTAALGLARKGAQVDLFEAGDALGGVARSIEFAGHRFCPGPQYLWGFGDDEPATAILSKLGVRVPSHELPATFEQLKLGDGPWQAVGSADRDVVRSQGDARFVASLDALGRAGQAIEARASFRYDGARMVNVVRRAVPMRDLVELVRSRNMSVLDLARATGASLSTVRRVLYSQGIFAERLEDLSAVLFAAARRHLLRPLRVPVGGVVSAIDALGDAVRATEAIRVHLRTRVDEVEHVNEQVVLRGFGTSPVAVDQVIFCCSPGALPQSVRSQITDFAAAHPIGVACFAVDLDGSARFRLRRKNYTWFSDDENPDVDFSTAGLSCRTVNFTVTTLNGQSEDDSSGVARHVVCAFFPHGRGDDIEVTSTRAEEKVRELLAEAGALGKVTIQERLRLGPHVWNERFGAFDGALYGRRLTSSSLRRSLANRMPKRMHLAHSAVGIPGFLGCLQMGEVVADEVLPISRVNG